MIIVFYLKDIHQYSLSSIDWLHKLGIISHFIQVDETVMASNDILVIDLFAGPGGLGEGFSSFVNKDGIQPFKIGISVEKESSAHKTLTTRAFYRLVRNDRRARIHYYSYIKGEISRDQLFNMYPREALLAHEETLFEPRTLGLDNDLIHKKVRELTQNHNGYKVVIGGPPCQAYSLAGRSRNAGNQNYVPEEDARHFLYKEYLEILSIVNPEVFIMENVRGILSAKINNHLIFPEILKDLKQPGAVTKNHSTLGYRIYSLTEKSSDINNPQYDSLSSFLIKSEEYGIPQARHRVILMGVREDIKYTPSILIKKDKEITIKEAIDDLPRLRSGLSKIEDSNFSWNCVIDKNANILYKIFNAKYPNFNLNELDLSSYPNLNRKETTENNIKDNLPKDLAGWLLDPDLDYVANHETRGHIESDLLRYAFCASYARIAGYSPKSHDFPDVLAPAHANWKSGNYTDRFRVQIESRPSTTITSHISKDGHYFIHYDPKQCRSLTVREAARLQTFPDNYFFEGNRTQQYVQVGNAVPPYLAQQIASIVMKLLE